MSWFPSGLFHSGISTETLHAIPLLIPIYATCYLQALRKSLVNAYDITCFAYQFHYGLLQ
jgi:hypothetical protein